jgi:hypothetical protein
MRSPPRIVFGVHGFVTSGYRRIHDGSTAFEQQEWSPKVGAIEIDVASAFGFS